MSNLNISELNFLKSGGHFMAKRTKYGGIVALKKMVFTYALLNHVPLNYFDEQYVDRYCYPCLDVADQAFFEWEGIGEPLDGWVRYKGISGDRFPDEKLYNILSVSKLTGNKRYLQNGNRKIRFSKVDAELFISEAKQRQSTLSYYIEEITPSKPIECLGLSALIKD